MKLFLSFVVAIVLFTATAAYSQDKCEGIICDSGWTMEQNTWNLQVSSNPDRWCLVTVCYCTNFDDIELPQISVKRIIINPPCAGDSTLQLDPALIKIGIITEFTRDHQGFFNCFPCDPNVPEGPKTLELITSQCYAVYTVAECFECYPLYGILESCGESTCIQAYSVCWDYDQSPPVLVVKKWGLPEVWGDCGEPILTVQPPLVEWQMEPCMNWCQ